MARGTPHGAVRGAYRRKSEALVPRPRVDRALGAFEISPAEVFVTLAALCDPDAHAASLVEQAGRRGGSYTALGKLLGDAISEAVYGRHR